MLKASQMCPSSVQETLGPVWNFVLRGSHVKTTSPPDPQPIPFPVTEGPVQSQVASTRNAGNTTKSVP